MLIQRVGQRIISIGGPVYTMPRGAAVAGNGLLNNLIAYYKLDEVAGANDALDAHTGGLTLTQTHSPGSMAGKIGTARTMDGANDYFSRVDDAAFSTGDVDFTISAWVYLNITTANSAVFCKYLVTGNQREYALFYNNNDHVTNKRFSFAVSSNGTAYVVLDANTFGAPAATTWYHVVAWHDAANNLLGISVNDVVDTVAYALGVFNSTAATAIGRLTGTYTMNGAVDELGFWKSVAGGGGCLSAAQRTALYAAGAGLPYASFTT